MRIDAISIENIASLLGQQQVIDLRLGRSPVGGAGLIAITGPTGAGKSTILDCICLALFGQTPRQQTRQGEPGALLSRSASAGQVVLELTLDDGTPWRVLWSIRRARDRLDQKLQPAVRSIIDPRTDAVLASGATEVSRLVSEGLRLSLEQFSSVVLLAQGDFARFLRANDVERAGLLELLTGTALYSRLGQAAYERWKALDLQCSGQDAILAQIPVLAEEARAALMTEQAALHDRRAAATAELDRRSTDRDAVVAWTSLQGKLGQAETACSESDQAVAAAAGDRERLRLAEAVVPVLVPLAGVEEAEARLRTCRTQAQDAAARASAARTEAQNIAEKAGIAIARAASMAASCAVEAQKRSAWAALTPRVVNQLRDAYAASETLGRRGAESLSLSASLLAQLPGLEAGLEQATRVHGSAVTLRTQALDALQARDQAIVTLLQGTTIEALTTRHQILVQARELLVVPAPDLRSAQAAVAAADRQVQDLTLTLEEAQRVSTLAQDAVVAQDAQIRRLEELARVGAFVHLVVADQPCPLCGSIEHPTPACGGEQGLTAARVELNRLREALTFAQKRALQAQTHLATSQAQRQQVQVSAQRAEVETAARTARWAPLGNALGLPGDPRAVALARIEEDMAACAAMQKGLAVAQQDRDQCQRALTKADAQLATAATGVALAQQALEQARTRASETAAEATRLAGEHREAHRLVVQQLTALCTTLACPVPSVPAAWIADLPHQCEEARQLAITALALGREVERLTLDWQGLMPAGEGLPTITAPEPLRDDRRLVDDAGSLVRTALAGHKAAATSAVEADTLRQAVIEAERGLTAAQNALTLVLASCPCPTVEAVRQAQLPDAARQALRHTLEQLDQRAAVCASDRERLRGESIVALKGLRERHLDPEEPQLMERLVGLCAEAERIRSEVDRRVGEIHAQLEQDRQACDRRAAIIATQVHQRASRDRADRLRQLIGSADSSRFSRYAQALTLDLLIEYANHRLLTLAPRYHLRREPDVRDGEPSLALRVVDHDQADTERSISTLSGGETFLASLALALALADLNRGRLKVETLCIDEGFGTLDEQTLAQAMATLERLQVSQSTQILLISHIGALHERLAHRIEVERRGGGASWVRLVGPDGEAAVMPTLPPISESDAADQTAMNGLLAAIRERGGISNAEGQILTGRDAGGVRALLKVLVEQGHIVSEGRGKGARYGVASKVTAVETSAIVPDSITDHRAPVSPVIASTEVSPHNS